MPPSQGTMCGLARLFQRSAIPQRLLYQQRNPCFRALSHCVPAWIAYRPSAVLSKPFISDDEAPLEPITAPGSGPKDAGPLRDELIRRKAKFVRLINPAGGPLSGPFPIVDILKKIDRSQFYLQQVMAAKFDGEAIPVFDPETSGSRPVNEMVEFPICKVINKKEEADKQRLFKKKLKENKSSSIGAISKEVQLSWSVTPNDLNHKLTKAKKELLKGARIYIVVTNKGAGKKYFRGRDVEEDGRKDMFLQNIQDFLCHGEEEGQVIGKKFAEVEWQRGGSTAVVSFEKTKAR